MEQTSIHESTTDPVVRDNPAPPKQAWETPELRSLDVEATEFISGSISDSEGATSGDV